MIEARSEPASGSLNPWHQMTSPAAIGGRWRARWDSVPWRMIVGPTQLTPMYWAPRGSWWAHISSRTAVCSHGDAPRPPNSSGHARHSSPVSASSPAEPLRHLEVGRIVGERTEVVGGDVLGDQVPKGPPERVDLPAEVEVQPLGCRGRRLVDPYTHENTILLQR